MFTIHSHLNFVVKFTRQQANEVALDHTLTKGTISRTSHHILTYCHLVLMC